MKSLSIFVGSGFCNARCNHCAGKPLRKWAPITDTIPDEDLIKRTMIECFNKGARYLSISSSGEPTFSPVSVLRVLQMARNNNLNFNPINLYSNGIRLADREFADYWLSQWKQNGLTTIYITIHSLDEKRNAEVYGISHYPSIPAVIYNVKSCGLKIRANIILSKNIVSTADEFTDMAQGLIGLGIDKVSTWPVRKEDDTLDMDNYLPEYEITKIRNWINRSGLNVVLMSEDTKKDYAVGDKLTLFPNGVLSNTWCAR